MAFAVYLLSDNEKYKLAHDCFPSLPAHPVLAVHSSRCLLVGPSVLYGADSGVSRISARGVLKVRPHTKSVGGGGGGGEQSASGPIPLFGTQKIRYR